MTRKSGNDNSNSNNGVKITLTTSTGTHTEHPDSAVWNKSPFSKKYKTHPPTGSKGKIPNSVNLAFLAGLSVAMLLI